MTPLAHELARTGRMVLAGRGPEYATAREIALEADGALPGGRRGDDRHRPRARAGAALDERFPVWLCVAGDSAPPAVREAVGRARETGAPLIASGPAAGKLEGARALPVAEPPEPLLSPLLSVLPGRVFAAALATAKGIDPEAPRHLRKVTLAR